MGHDENSFHVRSPDSELLSISVARADCRAEPILSSLSTAEAITRAQAGLPVGHSNYTRKV